MMSDRQIKRVHHKVYRNGLDQEKVRLITGHVGYLTRVRGNKAQQRSADVVSLKIAPSKATNLAVKPRLPESIKVVNYKDDQVPYIEPLGWVLVYLFKRYPELKHTKGFSDGHIKGDERVLRKGFFETHAYSTIDVGCDGQSQNITIDIVHGRFDANSTRWSVEIFADGGLVRKYICETQDQVVAKLDQQLHKYRLIQLAWDQAQSVR
ncbi:hypothetical protein [Alkalimarinus sediminis]|uniref:Uncharacterized protein n=1 Tax=Alkalimarinus sediminis TaxID=1632866 RepID=A0A9E8HL14_9ALTE|nr:hypothetical protein [Alkalimarinus sediminis]UZW74791.1 hypothetical protein NNL22_17495 [Alkalimarinus sediminis]